MKKYKEYKDTGNDLIGKIPAHWEISRFGSLFNLKPVKPHHNEELLSVFLEFGVIPACESEKRTHKPSEDLSKYQLVEPTDFVMNNQQAWRGSVGVSTYTGIISPAYHIFKMPKQLIAPYANYLLRDGCMVGQYEKSSKGVGSIQRTLNFNWLNNSVVIIPPGNEQRQIVSFLENKTSEIDDLVSKTEREIELLKELKQAVIAHVVTKGLNPDVKMKDSGVSWIGEIPEHWSFVRNKNIFTGHYEEVGKRTDIPLLSLTTEGVILRDVSTGKGKFPKDFEKYNVVYPDCIIFCLFDIDETPRTVGLNHNYGMITNAYDAFTINQNVVPRYITYYYLAVDNVKGLRPYYSGLRKVIQYNRFLQLKVPMPPMDEQQEIVNYIDHKTTQIDKMIVELTYKVEYLKQYKQRLIADVVTGKINVQPE